MSAAVPVATLASPTQETKENDFLDLVDGEGNILVQGMGIDGVNAKRVPRVFNFQLLVTGPLKAIASRNQRPGNATAFSGSRRS